MPRKPCLFLSSRARNRDFSVISSERVPIFCHLERAERVERSPEARSGADPSCALGTLRGFLDSVVGRARPETQKSRA